MATEAQILKALSTIIDPDFQKDIVSLGFVKNLKLEGAKASFDVELTTPACPVKDKFRADAEANVLALDGIEEVAVNMTAQPPKKNTAMQESGLTGVECIIGVSSCKGGVGKSSVAAMLATEVANRGFKVGLLDADLFGPSVPTLFNMRDVGVQVAENKHFIPEERGNLKLMSFGFWTGDAPAVMRGPMVANYTQQLLHQVAWGKLDYLFIDMPPGTGDIHLTITQTIQMSGAVIVTTPHGLSLADVGKGILMFDKVNVPVVGIIENMSYYDPGDGTKHRVFGTGGGQKLVERFGLPQLAELPISPDMAGVEREIDNTDIARNTTDEVIKAIGKATRQQDTKPAVDYDDQHVTLTWNDGSVSKVNNATLRRNCRCAQCVNEMTGEKILTDDRIPDTIRAEEVRVIGNYAIAIKWSVEDCAGMYPYKAIQALAEEGDPAHA